MKEIIWKFELKVLSDQIILMPKGAKVLCVQVQNDFICLWAICDAEALKEKRKFSIFGTGHRLEGSDKKYIGTIQLDNGSFVGHVFEQGI